MTPGVTGHPGLHRTTLSSGGPGLHTTTGGQPPRLDPTFSSLLFRCVCNAGGLQRLRLLPLPPTTASPGCCVWTASLGAGHLAAWTPDWCVMASRTVWTGQTKNAVVRLGQDEAPMLGAVGGNQLCCSGTSGPPTPPQTPSPCSSKQFSCASGECVHLDRRCDLQRDCVDGSDEKDCSKLGSLLGAASWGRGAVQVKAVPVSSPAADCIMSSWTAWSSCSVSCGLGSLFRQREVLREAVPGGSCGGARFDSRACFPGACPGCPRAPALPPPPRQLCLIPDSLVQLTAAGRSGRSGRSVTRAAEGASARGTEPAPLLPPKTAGGNVRGGWWRVSAATASPAATVLVSSRRPGEGVQAGA